MKIRKDFVSNSSSCSFVINNPVGCVEAFSKVLGMTTEEVIKDLTSNYVPDLNEIMVYVFQDNKTWDNKSYTFVEFLEMFSKETLNKQNVVEFQCDDYDSAKKTMLRYLYNAFKKCGYEVDAESSEHPFMYDTDSKVTELLSKLT